MGKDDRYIETKKECEGKACVGLSGFMMSGVISCPLFYKERSNCGQS